MPQSTPACPLSLSDFKTEIRFKLWSQTACDQIPAPIRTRGQQCHLIGLLEEPASLPTVMAHDTHSHILTQGLKTTIMTTKQLHSVSSWGRGGEHWSDTWMPAATFTVLSPDPKQHRDQGESTMNIFCPLKKPQTKKPTRQPVSHPVSNQLASQPDNQLARQPTTQLTNQPTNQPDNQSHVSVFLSLSTSLPHLSASLSHVGAPAPPTSLCSCSLVSHTCAHTGPQPCTLLAPESQSHVNKAPRMCPRPGTSAWSLC